MISWFEKNVAISWGITIIIAVLIFYVSSLTFGTGGGGFGINALLYHLGAFFVLAMFLFISLSRGRHIGFIFLGVILAVVYGAFDEIHQFFVPGRASSIFDVFIDSIGVLFAFMIYTISVVYRDKFRLGRREL